MRRWIPPLKTAPSCVKAVSVLMAIPKRGFPRAGLIRATVDSGARRMEESRPEDARSSCGKSKILVIRVNDDLLLSVRHGGPNNWQQNNPGTLPFVESLWLNWRCKRLRTSAYMHTCTCS